MRRRAALLSALLALAVAVPAAAQRKGASGRAHAQVAAGVRDDEHEGHEITLTVGETKTISAKNVKNFSEGSPGLVDVKVTTDGNKFVLVGKKPGATTLLLIYYDGTQTTLSITVTAQPIAVVERELAQLLEGVEGVRVRRVGARLVLDGRVASEQDQKRVAQIATLYQGQVENLTTVARGVPGGPDTQYLVRIDFYFVQYDKNSSFALGVGWPSSIGGNNVLNTELSYDLLRGAPRSATASLTNQPLPKLDIASRHGWAKVLKQATVVTSNGVEAQFQNGGEQLFPTTQGLAVGIQRVQYGADVSVLPIYVPDTKTLDVKLVAEVADLTASATGTPLPGRITSKLQTRVSLKLGQALVLSGIRSRTKAVANAGLPGLSEIPILGALFGSKAMSSLETEGAIFIVPSVVTSIPSSARDVVDQALKTFEDFDGSPWPARAYDSAPGGGVGAPPPKKD